MMSEATFLISVATGIGVLLLGGALAAEYEAWRECRAERRAAMWRRKR